MDVKQYLTSARIDPFYAYLELTSRVGSGQAFLLDAAKDAPPMYRMSVIGVLPVLHVSVKDGEITLTCVSGLMQFLRETCSLLMTCELSAEEFHTSVRVRVSDPMFLLEQLRRALHDLAGTAHDPFSQGFLGYFGYDAVHYLERLPKTTRDDRHLPDLRLQWHLATLHIEDTAVKFYHNLAALRPFLSPEKCNILQEQLQAVEQTVSAWRQTPPMDTLVRDFEAAENQPTEVVEDVAQLDFEQNVSLAKEYIRQGDVFQVVLSKRMRIAKAMHPYVAYERLRSVNPSPYMFMAEYDDMRLFGASPEVQFRSVGGVAEMKPIAGTSKGRGRTPQEDARLASRLQNDEKERAEHVMLVDLCRNDLGRVCETGTVTVEGFMTVEPYSHLFHLVSTVHGRLLPEVSVFHALLSTFPAGTLSGAPKIRAMEIIDELETLRRGPYGGMIGMVDFDANANLAIVIRSVVDVDNRYYIQVGAGIVADSDPTQEWLECGHKAGALMQVLTGRAME